MQMKVLGCGPILQENPFQNCSGYLIDHQILFDCGPGIWRALNETGMDAGNIHHIVISHFHLDHVSDLAPLLMARYLMLDKIKEPLSLIGPKGLDDWYHNLIAYCGSWIEKIPVRLSESAEDLNLPGYQLISALTGHSEESLCYRLEDSSGNTIFYSGDSDENAAIPDLARNSDLALIEASNTEETKVKGHLTPGRAAKLAEIANVTTLLLTHMYPEVSQNYALAEAKKYFSGEIRIARDGLMLNIDGNKLC